MDPDFLKGKKTYIGAALVALTSVGGYLSGHTMQALPWAGVAVALYGLRRAIFNLVEDAKKAV